MSEAPYTPSAWGNSFHALGSDIDEVLGAGSAGCGKTMCLLMDPLEQIIVEHQRCANPKHPYHQQWGTSRGWALHLRREWGELSQTINESKRIFPQIDEKATYNSKDYMWEFSSGYKYQFGHCQNLDSHSRYLGLSLSHIGFDELTQFSVDQYEAITNRLRSGDPVLMRMLKVRSMSNPGTSPGSDPQWVRRRFVDPCPDGKKIIREQLTRRNGEKFYKQRLYWPAKLTDNPNPEFAERYEKQLLGKAAHLVKAYLDGDWYFTKGSFFGEDFDPAIHVVNTYRPPDDWPVFRSMDWGFKSPGVVGWYAMTPDEDLVKFYEFKFMGRTDKQVADDIKRIEKRLGYWGANGRSRITGPADTQLWEERGDTAKRKIDVFMENGVPWVQADKRSRAANAERLTKRLKDHQGGIKDPGIMFMSCCKYTITTLPQIQTDPNNIEEPLKGGEDHAIDETMYACAYASHGAARIHVASDEKDEFEDEDEQPQRVGRYGYGSEVC